MQNAFLKKLENFLSLPPADRIWLENFFSKPRTVPSGTDLVREGECLANVHVLLGGIAARYKRRPKGTEQFLAYLVPGDFCDLHVTLLQRMDHGIRTLSPSIVVDIPRDAVLEAVTRRPELAKAFWWCSLLNEAVLREWVFVLARSSASQRLAHLFCEMFARLHSIGLTQSDGSFELPVTQLELSRTVGLSEVHVQRSLKQLKALNLLSFDRSRVRIENLAQLYDYAEFDESYLYLKPRQA